MYLCLKVEIYFPKNQVVSATTLFTFSFTNDSHLHQHKTLGVILASYPEYVFPKYSAFFPQTHSDAYPTANLLLISSPFQSVVMSLSSQEKQVEYISKITTKPIMGTCLLSFQLILSISLQGGYWILLCTKKSKLRKAICLLSQNRLI